MTASNGVTDTDACVFLDKNQRVDLARKINTNVGKRRRYNQDDWSMGLCIRLHNDIMCGFLLVNLVGKDNIRWRGYTACRENLAPWYTASSASVWARWFIGGFWAGGLGVPLRNDPFQKGIPKIPTTGPETTGPQTISWGPERNWLEKYLRLSLSLSL